MLEHMTHKDYNQTQKVFEKYCTDIGDYHDLFVPTDTSLLADLFEKFRDKWLGLDPSYFLPAPELEWKVFLKKQK